MTVTGLFASDASPATFARYHHFDLNNFGVNLTVLAPGAASALLHTHSRQDEFVYVISGTPTLVTGSAESTMHPGDCVGFRAGTGIAHRLVNRGTAPVEFLEVGDRSAGDQVTYPDDDLRAISTPSGAWSFQHKNGDPY